MIDNLPLLVTLIVGVLGGGATAALAQGWRDRKKTALDLFYPTWVEEMSRRTEIEGELVEKIERLEFVIVSLTDAITELGGDPLAIRLDAERLAREASHRT